MELQAGNFSQDTFQTKKGRLKNLIPQSPKPRTLNKGVNFFGRVDGLLPDVLINENI